MITVPFYNCVVHIRTTVIKKRGIIIFHKTLELERKATILIHIGLLPIAPTCRYNIGDSIYTTYVELESST